jgi:phage-related protein
VPPPNQPTPLPLALQPTNVVLAELAKLLREFTDEVKALAAPAKEAAKGVGSLTKAVAEGAAGLKNSAALAGLAFKQIEEFTSAISSQVGRFVKSFNPIEITRFQIAVNDLQGSIGEALMPVLRDLTAVVRRIGDTFASLTPAGKSLVAALAGATVGIGVATVAVYGLSAAIAFATGGISVWATAVGIATGAVAGGFTGMALALKDTAAITKGLEPVFRVASAVMNAAGQAMKALFQAIQPAFAAFADLARRAGDALTAGIGKALPGLLRVAGAVGDFVRQLVGVAGDLVPVVADLAAELVSAGLAIEGGMMEALKGVADVALALVPSLVAVVRAGAAVVTALMQFQGAISSIVGPVVRIIGSVLAPAVRLLLVPLEMAANAVGLLASALGAAFSAIGSVVGPVLSALADVITAPFKAAAGVIGHVTGTMRQAFGVVQSAISEVGAAFAELGDALRGAWAAIKSALAESGALDALRELADTLKGQFLRAVVAVTNGVRLVALVVKQAAEQIRDLFGISRPTNPDSFRDDASLGKGFRSTQVESVSSFISRFQASAFGAARPDQEPVKQTATNTGAMADALKRIAGDVEAIKNVLPNSAGSAARGAVEGAAMPGGRLLWNTIFG